MFALSYFPKDHQPRLLGLVATSGSAGFAVTSGSDSAGASTGGTSTGGTSTGGASTGGDVIGCSG